MIMNLRNPPVDGSCDLAKLTTPVAIVFTICMPGLIQATQILGRIRILLWMEEILHHLHNRHLL